MRGRLCRRLVIIIPILVLGLVYGCGGSRTSAGNSPPEVPAVVGSASCINNCHARTQDITATFIAAAWQNTTHTTDGGVICEDCHGPGGEHWGVGPIPYPNPQAAQCNACHGLTGFDATAHANPNNVPDKFFFQADAGNGQAIIIPRGSTTAVPEFLPDGVTPVTNAQHIQECSVCHNPSQRFVYNSGLVAPDPTNMPNPDVACAGCHDAHQPEQKVVIAQRSAPAPYPILRKFIVNPGGEQSFVVSPETGDESPSATSTQIAAIIYQPNGAVQPSGSVDTSKVVGTNNELNVERLCASCHTVGLYLYSKMLTHQLDIYSQWLNAGHSQRNAAAFAEFSANPPAYTDPSTGQPYPIAGSHQTYYPFDMALNVTGSTASTTQNAGNNNFACFKCHNGLTSLAWQDNVQGTPAAPVVFGDEPVTCITCHETHTLIQGTEFGLRVPVMMTNYSTPFITIQGNVFLDNTPLPSISQTENGTICIFCHQGRESGLTLNASKLASGTTITGPFFNSHYLGTAAMLWAVNGYEFLNELYGFNSAHQGANCPTCHMDNVTPDNQYAGHSWNPNVATCNTSDCHGSFGPVPGKPGTSSPDVGVYRASFDTNNYTGDQNGSTQPIAVAIQSLQGKLIALLAAQAPPIYYSDQEYPYFFADLARTIPFTAWTPNAYAAAFDLSFVIKGLPSSATSQTLVPNSSAAVHNYKYCIQLLQDSYVKLSGKQTLQSALPGAVRPPGTRPATVYGQGQLAIP